MDFLRNTDNSRKNMKKAFYLLVIFAAFTGFLAIAEEVFPAPVDSRTHFMKDALTPFVEDGRLPGAISVLYKDGKQETLCIGYADVENKRPITMDDIFMQASQTKAFCGVTIAMLVEEGKITLDDPVSKYLPEFNVLWVMDSEKDGVRTLHQAKNVLTIRMCMNHTGGFPFEVCAKRSNIKGGGWTGGAPLRSVAAIAAACPLRTEPGTKVAYSNVGFDIAAAIVEIVTGRPWDQFLKERVLDPLEMTSTTFYPTDEMLKNKIELYKVFKDQAAEHRTYYHWQQPPYNDSHVFVSAAAGLWTTANDQMKFYKMLMNKGVGDNGVRILKEETFMKLMTVNSRPKELPNDWYSLGLNADKYGWIGHGGALLTSGYVNWRTRELKLWVVQVVTGPKFWEEAKTEAERKFFGTDIDRAGQSKYTGRTKE